jgi:hypothetical protein
LSTVVDICFSVPIDGAIDTLTVKSSISWTEFRIALAEKMVQSASGLLLAYKFSTDAQKKPPNLLATPIHFADLIQGARDGLLAQAEVLRKGKKLKGGLFKIEIIDRDSGKGKEPPKKSGKTKNKVCIIDQRDFVQS